MPATRDRAADWGGDQDRIGSAVIDRVAETDRGRGVFQTATRGLACVWKRGPTRGNGSCAPTPVALARVLLARL